MLIEDFVTLTIRKQKNIALIAHDSKKKALIEWCLQNKDILKEQFLCGTGTTARMITDQTSLPVKGYNSGPLGGDAQIAARVAEGKTKMVLFFKDPSSSHAHEPDINMLIRICDVHNVPLATNEATAQMLLNALLLQE